MPEAPPTIPPTTAPKVKPPRAPSASGAGAMGIRLLVCLRLVILPLAGGV